MLKHEKNIEKQILKLESRSHSLTSDEAKTLHERKLELETLRNQKIKGIIFRSRAKWYEEGDKNTEYFLNLEKRNYINKNMSEIFDNNNVLQTDNSKILKINAAFFKKLYSNNYNKESKEVINNFLDTEVKLSEPDKEGCEGPLSLDECTLVLKMMKNGKCPGSDGFTTEFYKFFWKDIGSLVCHSINFAYNSGRLSDFQRQGLITCIPKDGRDRRHLKHWRPITLLNVDYKIASSVIANRMKLVLPNVISESQAGFLKGRFIGETTRIIGYLSDFFKCERGCRQGDPISPYLFILCVELLSLAVKRNENIKVIKINNVEYCIFQYADDTNFTLDGSQRTLLELLKTIKELEACSGLKMNMDKCTATWIGSKTGSNERLCAHIPLPWSKEPYKILGIMLSTDLNEMPSLNFEKQLIKARKILFTWSNRSLTINGKITIIKSQILPLFTNLFTTLPDPDKLFFKKLNTMFYKFIWYGKRDKIKRSMLMNDYKNGGLKMIDPKSFCRYLKVIWIKRLVSSNGLWQNLIKTILTDYGSDTIFSFQKTQLQNIAKCISNVFWKDVINNYALLKQNQIESETHFINTSLLNFIPPKTIKQFLNWYNQGLKEIKCVLTVNGEVKRFTSVRKRYNLNGNYLLYYKLIHYIPKYWLRRIKGQILNMKAQEPDAIITKLQTSNNKTFIYGIYITRIQSSIANICQKWSKKLNIIITETKLSQCFELIRKITTETKMQNFQFKILHRILTTNTYLKICGIQSDNSCSFCFNEPESLEHLFVTCCHSKILWGKFKKWFETKTGTIVNLDARAILLGDPYLGILLNHLLLIVKRYIYSCKYTKHNLNFIETINIIKYHRNIEKFILSEKEDMFKNKWENLI